MAAGNWARIKQSNRAYLDALLKRVAPQVAESKDDIRTQALARFTRDLDAKIKNLQEDEMLTISFRLDIVGRNGEIRGGQGHQRNMPEYAEWRSAVYQRDGYLCQECGAKGRLVAHHIKQWAYFPELRFDVSNGITLCSACHKKQHPHLGFVSHAS